MTKPVRPTPPPAAHDEESQVKSRPPSGHPSSRARFSSAPGEVLPHERLERKLRIGRDVLGTMSATDARARLLSMALLRRDEALLDGVLASLLRDEL